jgi:ATP/maltotriose-dependent transcriptional regulator MalT/DNA-binding winged helix-turn-helix (wHTH) protein
VVARDGRGGGPDGAPSCPRATLSFVGREAELARISELLDEEVLFLIYGVAGIGKTELAYRALELARERPGWSDALPTLVQVQPEMTEHHLVAVLRHRIGADGDRVDRLSGHARSLGDELDAVVRALEARPRLLFLDDIHLLDGDAIARILGHLARRVRASRVFAASRLEIPLGAVGVTPVVTRLAPLDEPAARRMLALLGRRLGVGITDESGILGRAGGSPFFLQHEVASSLTHQVGSAADRLVSTLLALPPDARRVLVVASVIFGRVAVAELSAGSEATASSLALLARHLFVELADGAVAIHDLVREAVLRTTSPAELLRARREAARVFAERASAGGAEGPLAAVEAARQLCAAGACDEALAFIARWHGPISAAGLDHLLLDTLEQLSAALPAEAASIDLLRARTLVRRGAISEAEQVLARVAADARVAGSVRYLTLAGTIASQRGDLRRAEACLLAAHQAAEPEAAGAAERARVALHLADVLSLRGETGRARSILAEVRPVCDEIGDRTVARWGWSEGLSWLLEEAFTRTIAAVAPFRERAGTLGAGDLAAQLTMLEVLARAELHDVVGARALADRIVAPAARVGALRAPLASFYMGIATWAEGDVRTAELALRDSRAFLHEHRSEILGLIVGHYLARVLAMRGDVVAAVDLFARTTQRAVEIGCGSITGLGDACHAHAVVLAGDPAAALTLARRALAEPLGGGAAPAYSRVLAHQAMALALAHQGDLPGARGQLDAALALCGDESAPRIDSQLIRAEVELCGGDPSAALRAAGVARDHYAECGRRFCEAHACVVLAAGHAALGGPGDLVMAEEALGRSCALATHHGYEALRLRGLVVRAAVLIRKRERAAAEQLLAEALATPVVRRSGLELLLGSALGSQRDHELPAGLVAQLALLGFRQVPGPEPEVIVDVAAATIATRRAVIKGRPVACALLACLADAQGQIVSPEVLYRTTWGASEYHPLRHRNTLYVAVKRLRDVLAELRGDRYGELIETLPGGWRLVAGVVARKTK